MMQQYPIENAMIPQNYAYGNYYGGCPSQAMPFYQGIAHPY